MGNFDYFHWKCDSEAIAEWHIDWNNFTVFRNVKRWSHNRISQNGKYLPVLDRVSIRFVRDESKSQDAFKAFISPQRTREVTFGWHFPLVGSLRRQRTASSAIGESSLQKLGHRHSHFPQWIHICVSGNSGIRKKSSESHSNRIPVKIVIQMKINQKKTQLHWCFVEENSVFLANIFFFLFHHFQIHNERICNKSHSFQSTNTVSLINSFLDSKSSDINQVEWIGSDFPALSIFHGLTQTMARLVLSMNRQMMTTMPTRRRSRRKGARGRCNGKPKRNFMFDSFCVWLEINLVDDHPGLRLKR